MLLQITEREAAPGIVMIELTGRFALGRESQRVETIVDDLIRAGHTRVILSLEAVTYIDSAGIGLVALAAGRLKEARGRLVAVAVEGRVFDMLKMTQVDKLVTLCSSAKAAVDEFGKVQPPATV